MYANLYAGEVTISEKPEFIARSEETDINNLIKVAKGNNDKNLYAAFENSVHTRVAPGGKWFVTVNGTFENELAENGLGFVWNTVYTIDANSAEEAEKKVFNDLNQASINIIY